MTLLSLSPKPNGLAHHSEGLARSRAYPGSPTPTSDLHSEPQRGSASLAPITSHYLRRYGTPLGFGPDGVFVSAISRVGAAAPTLRYDAEGLWPSQSPIRFARLAIRSAFVIRILSFLRHSSFGFRHSLS